MQSYGNTQESIRYFLVTGPRRLPLHGDLAARSWPSAGGRLVCCKLF
jgi:hypothetical protein